MARITSIKQLASTKKKKVLKVPVATEDQVQISIMQWALLQKHNGQPLSSYIVHIPNGGDIGAKKGAKLRKMGVKKGYPDLVIDIARGGYHGLRIELKRLKGGTVSSDQKDRQQMLRDEGYCAEVCKGFGETTKLIKRYLAGEILINDKGEGYE